MPRGKSHIRGGLISRPKLPKSLNEKSLLTYSKNKRKSFSKECLESYRGDIRDAVGMYLGQRNATEKHEYNVLITVKDQNSELRKVATAAKRYKAAEKGAAKERWKDKLLNLIEWGSACISLSTRDLIHRRLRRFDGDLRSLIAHISGNKKLDDDSISLFLDVLSVDQRTLDQMLEARYSDPKVLEIMKRATRNPSSKYRDQFLVGLINNLAPLWLDVTERTLKRHSVNAKCDKPKESYFANWIFLLIEDAGHTPPTKGSILDIVDDLEISKSGVRHK